MDGALFPSRMAALSLGVLGVMARCWLPPAFLEWRPTPSASGYGSWEFVSLSAHNVRKSCRRPWARIQVARIWFRRGLFLGILAGRVLAFIVYQATPRDPLVLAGTVLAMLLLGLLATWIPAQRALSIDPMILLREE